MLLSSKDLAASSALDEKAATQVVLSLFADRYFGDRRRIRGNFLTWDRVNVWLAILTALISASASCRHLWQTGDAADQLQLAISRYLDIEPGQECSLVAMIEVIKVIFDNTAPNPYPDARPDLVAPALLRLAWVADHQHDCLLKGFRLVGEGFFAGDPDAIRSANSEMWQCLAVDIEQFLHARKTGGWLGDRACRSTLREPSLSGRHRTTYPAEKDRLLDSL